MEKEGVGVKGGGGGGGGRVIGIAVTGHLRPTVYTY